MTEMNGAGALKELLERHGFRFSKAMGQNFLTDRGVLGKIARSAGVDETFAVLEVGPGAGALTRELSGVAGRVIAVELDSRLIPLLGEALAGLDNVTVVNADILKLDIAGLLRESAPGFRYALCANLPYNITTPALTAIIDAGVFESATVMIQREVARRICAAPDTPDYGAFTVYINYHAEAKILFDVPPECFIPRPGVVSSVIRLVPHGERALSGDDEAMLFRVVKAAFGQRRKTLVNALSAAFGARLSKAELESAVTSCGFDARARGETLGLSEFIRLAAAISDAAGNRS